ncbi:rifin PIR protein, putative [Plasmodium reichenowi]|uniref:Rifin PIR protein, putative n=2 Tax=Plasmodium reichenowi TaxID=5854 RepID=A0A2P9DCK5_PLARE|nr:rifin PIR protein, putative [Plasmodium reichenowi]
MKAHYINIFLFALPLNILVNVHNKNPSSAPRHTQPNRSLCECELYTPANYDNDPQMKKIMENFDRQTSARFHEYDDRMVEKRKQCKDKCDKEIQKIILKDKLEKQMAEQLTTLETKITNDDIPTCVCEKSMADKMEKECLKCAQNLGGIVAPSSGVLVGIAEGALYAWKPAAFHLAMRAAMVEGVVKGAAAGNAAGKKVVIGALTHYGVKDVCPKAFESIRNIKNYTDVTNFSSQIVAEYNKIIEGGRWSIYGDKLNHFRLSFGLWDPEDHVLIGNPSTDIPNTIKSLVFGDAKTAATTKAAQVTATETTELQETYMAAVESTYGGFQTSITASIIAIVVIVLIMVIIYKILRYRRKKKMKKKLQYIKLLEE